MDKNARDKSFAALTDDGDVSIWVKILEGYKK